MLASIFYSISLLEIYPKDSKLNGCLGSQLGSILLCIRELTIEFHGEGVFDLFFVLFLA